MRTVSATAAVSTCGTPALTVGTCCLVATFAFLTGCERCGTTTANPSSPTCESETASFIRGHSSDYHRAIRRARTWLDALHVDPEELRAHQIKGKKKLVEQLDGYYRLWQIASPEERPALVERIRGVVSVTYEARYHNMGRINARHFKQDATSYLRAAILMERLGLDTTRYREEIAAIHQRLNDHMAQRGPHQRAVFHWYYDHFGLREPFPLGDALGAGYIARRADPEKFDLMDVYQVTHEIFVPYEYGERLDVDPFTDEDKTYLRTTLDHLTERYIARNNADLVAELISCMRYLRFVESPAYRNGLVYLLESQNPDGSWGDLERNRRRHGPWGLHHIILHTTMVSLDALSIAFHEPWNRDLFPGCEAS